MSDKGKCKEAMTSSVTDDAGWDPNDEVFGDLEPILLEIMAADGGFSPLLPPHPASPTWHDIYMTGSYDHQPDATNWTFLNDSSSLGGNIPGEWMAPPATATASPESNTRKQIRQDSVAFATKSETDNLDDGYRWRKYGQKPVKGSSTPRSYYKCAIKNCIVKKYIERSLDDRMVVITTYRGHHSHPVPGSHSLDDLIHQDCFPVFSGHILHPQVNAITPPNDNFILQTPQESEPVPEPSPLPYYDDFVGEGLLEDIVLLHLRKGHN